MSAVSDGLWETAPPPKKGKEQLQAEAHVGKSARGSRLKKLLLLAVSVVALGGAVEACLPGVLTTSGQRVAKVLGTSKQLGSRKLRGRWKRSAPLPEDMEGESTLVQS